MSVETHAFTVSDPDMEWREKIRLIRRDRRLSQKSLAEMIGVPQSQIAKWETGVGKPYFHHAVALSRALHVSLDFLADEDASQPPPAPDPRETTVVELARSLGYDVAFRRLALVPEIKIDGHPTLQPASKPSRR